MVKFTHEVFDLLGSFAAYDGSCYKYQHMLHNIPEQQKPELHHGRSLDSLSAHVTHAEVNI